ncbi:MAG TPA: putative cytokinetic ring protein SteA, partial [Actinomycetota bacterium]|nr:putative cytokinetic ring protein SteA [Actinomycetota bacterium]
MAIDRLRRSKGPPSAGEEPVTGVARLDRRTKNLLARLEPGEIAIIDHEDIDRVSAEGLVQRRAAAVVNAARSSTGRYPNLGPLLLCSAGVPLIDDAGQEAFAIEEGSLVRIDHGRVIVLDGDRNRVVARGRELSLEDAEHQLDRAKQALATQLERFAENTIEYIRDERDVLLEATRLPHFKTDFHGRHILIVVRGYDYKEDLSALRSYIREVKPVLVGVDGGADALLEAGYKPDVIIGDMDSVTTEALLCGAELVVHAYTDGRAPGLERLEALGLEATLFEATGTSEDIAMLAAFEEGAELIVAVGTHANLVEFLDKGRKGMASTFLTRLRVGPILVDAKGVGRLYRGRVRRIDLFLLVASALIVMALVIGLSEPMRLKMELLWNQLENAWFDIR